MSTTGRGIVVDVVVLDVVVDVVDVVVSGSSTDDEGSVTGATLVGPASSDPEHATSTNAIAAVAAASRTWR